MSIAKEYLDGEYAQKNPSFHAEDSPWKARQIMKGIKRCGLSPKSIAEVGCGAGEILVQLSKHVPSATFTGYELSPQGFALCQERETTNIHYRDTDIFATKERFDLVLCIDVFEHIEDCFTFLRRLSEKAETFIFHIPLDMNVQMVARSKPILGLRSRVGHLHYFSKDTALCTLKDCGFEVVDWFYTPWGVEWPRSFRGKLLQFPLKVFQAVSVDLAARLLGGYSLLVTAKKSRASNS